MTTINIGEENGSLGVTTLNFYDGNGNLIYVCKSPSGERVPYVFSVAAGNLTNIVVSGGMATVTTPANHGLQVGNLVTVSGSATSALNGAVIIVTVPSATTFTFATAAAPATYTDASASTIAPRSSAAMWSIAKQTFNGTNQLTLRQYAGGSTGYTQIADNRATLSYS